MSAISTILTRLANTVALIRSAIYAIDVRDDIADAIEKCGEAIEQCYSDVSNPTLQTEALEVALQNKIDQGKMAALTIGDHTITAAKLASGVIDNTLTTSGVAADAKAVGDALGEIKADLDAIVPGLSTEAKAALLACFAHVAWEDDNGQDYYDSLAEALDYTPEPAKIFLYKFNNSLASAGNRDLMLTAPTPSYVTGKYGNCVQIGTSADNVPRNFNISSENMPRFDKDFTLSLWFRNNASAGVTHTSFRFAKNISDNTVPMALAELTDLTYYNGYVRPNLTGNETINQRYVGITLFHLWADYANMYNPGFVFFNKEHTKGYTFNLNNESRKIIKQTWNHFAFCRKNNLCTIYINGLKACSFTYAGELYVPNQIVFGCALSQTDPNGITMQSGTIPNIDEFYINDRECIYNGEFTPAEITLS